MSEGRSVLNGNLVFAPECAKIGLTMETKESGAAGEESAKSEPADKVPITPRKAARPSPAGDIIESELQLTPTSNEAVWKRKNRIRPKSPKSPFDHPARPAGVPTIPQKITALRRHGPKRGLIGFFRSRRKGRYRILNFIVLPAAILIASLGILLLFKFH